MNEKELLSKARAGDLEAFGALVETYQERAVHTAYSFLGNFEDARDVAQEAFVKAYENLNRFQEQSRFYTWLYRILMNIAKDFLKKKRPVLDEEFILNAPDSRKSAAEELSSGEIGTQIRRALETLPSQQRSAFTLRYLEGLSLEETAESMDISLGAVKATLWQACDKMRKILKISLELEGTR